ncbi:MAG: hypothetical protein FWC62_07820 [Firmicutes bacterium]|nr:hypothetical protein [Bacillota bacterium]
MKKRFIFIFPAILLAFLLLAACSGNKNPPWTSAVSGADTVYGFGDGTAAAIPSGAQVKTSFKDMQNGKITFAESGSTILLANGVIVSAPINTAVSVTGGVCTITIGDGEATVTQTNGMAITVPSGTVIDHAGNF